MRKVTGYGLLIIVAIVGLFAIFEGAYFQPANEIAVVQSAWDGKLTVSFTPGPHARMGGTVTYYPRRGQIDFDGKEDQNGRDEVLHIPLMDIRFNDGAQCKMSGSLAWEMPVSESEVIALHQKYHSAAAIESQIIAKNIAKAVFVAGPMMSSAESYASRRNDLLSLIYDQVEHGAYKTSSHDVETSDPITGDKKSTRVVDIVMDSKGQIVREDASVITEFGLKTFNLVIDGVQYPPVVEQQIASQQQAIMAVQTAIAKAKTAEQDALTTAQQGKADAAKQKWEQEAIKAKEVTEAEKNLEVVRLKAMADLTNAVIAAQRKLQEADLAAQAAEKTKQAQIALGEGEAKRAQLVMQANGALEQKLAAYVQVQQAYAAALGNYHGPLVPQTVMGSGSGTATAGGVNDLIQLLTAQTARQLSLDTTMESGAAHASPKQASVQLDDPGTALAKK